MKLSTVHYPLLAVVMILSCGVAAAQTKQVSAERQYDEQINQLWNQKKARYADMIKKSGENPQMLYAIQAETNNLLKYAGYCQKYALLDELSRLYLGSLDTLTETDQYLFAYYPNSPKLSVHPLDRKYRMWVNKQKPTGMEDILSSSQFLYLLSDVVSIIVGIKKEERSAIMKEALSKFIPLLSEHYKRWVLNSPGPFQVHGWGCRFDGKPVPTGMNHFELLTKKLDRRLGNGESPAYCNAVTDFDILIIAGVANILVAYNKEKDLVRITPEEYKKLLVYVKTGAKLLERGFSYTQLRNFDGKSVAAAVFEPGLWDRHPDHEVAGYSGQDYPRFSSAERLRYQGKGAGWDSGHGSRFVHVLETLLRSRDVLGLDFPTRVPLEKMANQLVYGAFNGDFKKPLFTNFMDGTNGWYRAGYSGRAGFGYGPWDMSLAVLKGGYGFWSVYNKDVQKIFVALAEMVKSNDPEIRSHMLEHYETSYWSQFKRPHDIDFKKPDDPNTQSVLIQFIPSLCFISAINNNACNK